MQRWQSYRRPNFRSQLILSDFFASQTAIKKCLNTGVDYTVLHAIVHADWPVQMLSVAIAGSRAWAARSSIDQPSAPNFALLGDQNPNLSLTSFKRRRTWQLEQAKKKSTGQSSHRACNCRFCWTGPAVMIVVALRAEDCFKKALNSKLWRKEHSICTLLMIEQTLISLAFTHGQPKLTKLWKKTCNRCPHRQHVTFLAGHAESTIPLNSENWVHELLIPQVQYYPPARTNMKKHLKVTSDEEKLVSLLCEWVLIDHGFRDHTLLSAHLLAKKSLKQLLTDPHEHSQTCFLYFRGRGIHWWRRFSCAVNESWRKIQVQTLHCSQQLLQSSQNNQTSTRKKLNTPRKQPHRSQLRAMKKTSKIRSFLWCTF